MNTLALFAITLLGQGPTGDWKPIASEGVQFAIAQDNGPDKNPAFRMDYDFKRQAGFVLAEKDFKQKLPANYEFSFWMRAESPRNDFEFKLIDPSGKSVWWSKQFAYDWPNQWKRIVFRKNQLVYAWGDIREPMTEAGAVQIGVAANAGGAGKVWISGFEFKELPPVVPFTGSFRASATSGDATGLNEGRGWRAAEPGKQSIELALSGSQGMGAIDLQGLPSNCNITVEARTDANPWTLVQRASAVVGGQTMLDLPNLEASQLRVSIEPQTGTATISRLKLFPPEAGQTPQAFLETVAQSRPKGLYPKRMLRKQEYWTVFGGLDSDYEGLLSENGAVELDRGGQTLEPFLRLNGRLVTWADVSTDASLPVSGAPIPALKWNSDVAITTRAFATEDGRDRIVLSYSLKNLTDRAQSPTFSVALRPFQVNPSWQYLNMSPLVARIDSLRFDARHAAEIKDGFMVIPLQEPTASGATTLESGDILPYLSQGTTPNSKQVESDSGRATGLWTYQLNLAPGEQKEIYFECLRPGDRGPQTLRADVPKLQQEADAKWTQAMGMPKIALNGEDQFWADVVRSNLAYILINRDGPAIQPGSRTYQRTWLRDGSLTAHALLQFGMNEPVRQLIEFLAPNVRPDGWVPCVVDHRGPDPLAEHDSHGQFIYLLAEYGQFTGDWATVRKHYPVVRKVVGMINQLRESERTQEYAENLGLEHGFYGLLPKSASHEGYMDNHRHSYWDDFFGVLGLNDAVTIAEHLGETTDAIAFKQSANEFEKDFLNSILYSMQYHGMREIPGCVELGDFDATSTAIGVYPCRGLNYIPKELFDQTFDKYADFFFSRADNTREWRDFTPYEVRTLSAMTLLGRRDEMFRMLDWFKRDMRPLGWHHWAEVGYKDPEPGRWIGDMPHTWVGSDFIKSFRTMLVHESDSGIGLELGLGIRPRWLEGSGVQVTDMPTHFGPVSYQARKVGNSIRVQIEGNLRPNTEIVFLNPLADQPKTVRLNGVPATLFNNRVHIGRLPARIELTY